ncbi:hypothetical protein [Flavobacterium sp.]|uniref:hypothetical protein n=1 Tax=Flavobacterium sp. TaxID=239 RepID=UPI0031D45D08
MAVLNPKNYTYNVAKEIQEFLYTLRNLQSEYCDIIKVVEVNDQLFYFHDLTHPDFYFLIGIPDKKSQEFPTLFPVRFNPVKYDSREVFSKNANKSEIEFYFSIWIKMIEDYNSVNFNQEEDFAQLYEEEIFSEFEIIDDDAKTKPFDTNQQIILYTFLQATVNYLEKEYTNNEIVEEIINEANSLKNEIPSLTKRIASKRLSQILAKIKKFNPITFKDVYDVAKKEVIKYLLLKGVETLPKLVNSITAFLGS